MRYERRQLFALCEKIVAYARDGDPVKDVIEFSPHTSDELIVRLAKDFIRSNKGK